MGHPWEQRKLRDVATDFIVPMRDKPKSFGGTIPWTRIEDIEGRSISRSLTDQNVSEETIKTMNLKIIPKGSLIVSASASFGIVALVKADLITNQTFIGIVPSDNIDVEFLFYSFMSPFLRKEMKDEAAGSTIFYIPQDRFKNMRIFVPERSEQIRICTLFSNLDNLITLHQRKLDLLKEKKKGLLQKMFPKPGENKPELRFSGFTDPWEQRKVREISEIVGGGTPSTNNPDYWDGDIDWYTPAEITDDRFAFRSQRRITGAGLKNSSAKILPTDRTILFTSRAGIGKSAILKAPGATNQGFQSLVLNDSADPKFVYSATDFIKEKAERIAAGSTFSEISGKKLGEITLMIPSKPEQKQIGQFFESIDESITLHQRKLDLLKEKKKGLFQKMFPKPGQQEPELRFSEFR